MTKSTLVFLALLFTSSAQAKVVTPEYEFETGELVYEVATLYLYRFIHYVALYEKMHDE